MSWCIIIPRYSQVKDLMTSSPRKTKLIFHFGNKKFWLWTLLSFVFTKIQALVDVAHGKLGVTFRKLERQFKIVIEHVSNILRKETVIRTVRKPPLKYNENEKKNKKQNITVEFLPCNGREIIIDDLDTVTPQIVDTTNCLEGRQVEKEVYFKR